MSGGDGFGFCWWKVGGVISISRTPKGAAKGWAMSLMMVVTRGEVWRTHVFVMVYPKGVGILPVVLSEEDIQRVAHTFMVPKLLPDGYFHDINGTDGEKLTGT